MPIAVIEESSSALSDYGRVPIRFVVESRYRVEPVDGGLGGLALVEERVAPYVKDYDACPEGGPVRWPERWDISRWGLLSAFDGPERVGGAAIAWKAEALNDPEMRDELALLWDLRVHPDYRGRRIGQALFERALAWARARECTRLKVETQNVNVPACRFYAAQGCVLGAINRFAYAEALDEVQLLWYRDL